MANRWISCLKEPPVSQLKEDVLVFSFLLGTWQEIKPLSEGVGDIVRLDKHSARLAPGDYRIILEQEDM